MLSALFATSLFFGAYEVPEPTLESGAVLELMARVSETRIVALNPTGRAQLLVFSNSEGTLRSTAVVPPGAGAEYDFPRGTLDGLALALVIRDEHGVHSTGRLSLADMVRRDLDLVWVESVDGEARAWGDLPAGPTSIPVQNGSGSGLENLMAAPAPAPHVPVITPTDKPKGDLPPRIEPDPLPPV